MTRPLTRLALLLLTLAPAVACTNVLDTGPCPDGLCAHAAEDGARPLVSTLAPLPFVSVSDGRSYTDGLLLQVQAPPDTDYVVYSAAVGVLGVSADGASLFAIRAELQQLGFHEVIARAFQDDDTQIAEGRVSLTIIPPDQRPTVVFTTPRTEGGHYLNGLWLKVSVSDPVVRVRYSADGWPLGDSTDFANDFALRYTFSQPGPRALLAEGIDPSGAVVASDRRSVIIVDPSAPTSTRAGLAGALLAQHAAGTAVLWAQQFGGRLDGADALANVRDTAEGRAARRSVHGTAPGGEVDLSEALLEAMVELERDGFRYFVTSVAGGSHSYGSLHYAGRAFDIDEINGVRISGDSALAREFMAACWALGAVEVFGPSNDPSGHFDHLHCAF